MERSPRWFSTETNWKADGRYFTSIRNSPSSADSASGVTRKSGEKSSRPNLSGAVGLRKGRIWYRARRKMDSTRASAMRLLTSRRSIIPQETGQSAETAPKWCELNSRSEERRVGKGCQVYKDGK